MHKPKELVLTVGGGAFGSRLCPLQAIVAAFGLDERTVARWEREAGMHCRRVHEHVVEAGRVELGQVQVDELRVRLKETLETGMFLVGTCYNFCWEHKSMRREREGGDPPGGKWVQSTTAQTAGLTDHRWSVEELLSFCVQPAEIPKWRGRRPRWLMEAACAA